MVYRRNSTMIWKMPNYKGELLTYLILKCVCYYNSFTCIMYIVCIILGIYFIYFMYICLCNQKRNLSWIRQKMRNFPIDTHCKNRSLWYFHVYRHDITKVSHFYNGEIICLLSDTAEISD